MRLDSCHFAGNFCPRFGGEVLNLAAQSAARHGISTFIILCVAYVFWIEPLVVITPDRET